MNPQQIEDIKARIVAETGISDLPEAVREHFIEEMAQNAVMAIARMTDASILRERRSQYEALQSAGDSRQMQAFLEDVIPHYNDRAAETVRSVIAHQKQMAGKIMATA